MPGPCNSKKKKDQQQRKAKQKQKKASQVLLTEPERTQSVEDAEATFMDSRIEEEPKIQEGQVQSSSYHGLESEAASIAAALKQPFVFDAGDGPRVKDMRGFLSSFFVPPPSLDESACCQFAEPDICLALQSILPYEIALVRD